MLFRLGGKVDVHRVRFGPLQAPVCLFLLQQKFDS